MSDTTGQTRYFRDRRGNRWRVHPDGRTEIRWSDTDPWRTSAGDLAWLLDHSEITEEAGPTPAEDTAGQTPARDEMVKAGAEAILHYMGEWGTDDDTTEAKAHELAQWVLDAALAGRTVVELSEPDERHSDIAIWLAGRFDVETRGHCVTIMWHSDKDGADLGPRAARSLASALLAAVAENERMAAESGQDGDSDA